MAYEWTLTRAVAVAVSSLLGLAVSLTMFLVVGVVGALPYNIVGHIKTVSCATFPKDTWPCKVVSGALEPPAEFGYLSASLRHASFCSCLHSYHRCLCRSQFSWEAFCCLGMSWDPAS